MMRIDPDRDLGDTAAGSPLVSLMSRRAAISACKDALAGLRGVLVACSDRNLVSLAGELDEVRALAGAGVVAVTAEAETRGVVAASQCASTAEWVADAAWHSRREASTIAKAAALLRQAGCEPVADAVCTGDVDLASAVACGHEFAKLAPDLSAAAKPVVLQHMLDIAGEHGPTGVRRLKDEILARYGDQGTFEEQCERRRRHIELSAGRHTAAGLWDYRLTVDGEGRAVLEAAIGPGSARKPAAKASGGSDLGATEAGRLTVTTRDTRPVGRRRGEALIDALRRSVAATERGRPTASPKSIVMLTMNYEDLAGQIATRLDSYRHHDRAALGEVLRDLPGSVVDSTVSGVRGAGVVLGSRAAGELISPDAARRIACDAGIIPVVLGSHGEVLNQGRLQRLFTQGQIRALWRRDRLAGHISCSNARADGDSNVPSMADASRLRTGGTPTGRTGATPPSRPASDTNGAASEGPLDRTRTHGSTFDARRPAATAEPARTRGPDPGVVWDLRPGTYHAPCAGDCGERLTA